jgi:DNA mismatch endonuclease, patch repair protein
MCSVCYAWEEALIGGTLMVDSITPALRSEIMSRVRGKDTRPEMLVRRLIHKAGFRYRLHVASLPGKPDLVFAGRKKVIFVHGCFWHMHEGCPAARMPKSRVDFWEAKLRGNRERDRRNITLLREAGWDVLTLWECELATPDLMVRVIHFLTNAADSGFLSDSRELELD